MSEQPVVTILPILGETLTSVEQDKKERIIFTTDKGAVYVMYHSQDCCESVEIEDINGDLNDLVGSPLTLAEEVSNPDETAEMQVKAREDGDESHTWTFYRFATAKGTVIIRWFGSSNGYYSESVDFAKIGGE
jgi:hypothetical protein